MPPINHICGFMMNGLATRVKVNGQGEVMGQDQNWRSKFFTPVAGGRIESMGVTPTCLRPGFQISQAIPS